jgi:hypothetical protein
LKRYVWLPVAFYRWRKRRDLLIPSSIPIEAALERIHFNEEQIGEVRKRLRTTTIVVLADIDRDSAFRSTIGPLPGVRTVTTDFGPRRRTRLHLVATADYVGIRKCYENRWRFVCELQARHALKGVSCRVPAIVDVDFNDLTITSAYVPGPNLDEALAEESAVVLDRDVEAHLPFRNLSGRALWLARLLEGKRVLDRTVTPDFSMRVRTEIQKMHRARVIWGDVKYGNIIIEEETGLPWLVDFDYGGYFPHLPAATFRALCDEEIALYNLHFQTTGPTPALRLARAELARRKLQSF